MQVERVDGSQGLLRLEVPNDRISRRMMADVIAAIPGVSIVRRPSRLWSLGADRFCEFTIGADAYEVWEMYGDSDRYEIGAKQGGDPRTLHAVAEALQRFTPFPLDIAFAFVDVGLRAFSLLIILACLPDLVATRSPMYALRGTAPLFWGAPLLAGGIALSRWLWVRLQRGRIAGGPLTMQ